MGCGQSTEKPPAQNEDTDDFKWDEDEDDDVVSDMAAPEVRRPPPDAMKRKRQSVSAECFTPGASAEPAVIKVVDKSEEDQTNIRNLLKDNLLFKTLDEEQVQTVVMAFERQEFTEGTNIIEQGDKVANWFYVLNSGAAAAFVKDVGEVKAYEKGGSFGELALLYNAPRAATVTAKSDVTTWALDRQTFREIVVESNARRRRDYESFLENVPILESLTESERSAIADVLEAQYYEEGAEIIKTGDEGTHFFILEDGEVTATCEGYAPLVYKRGDYFGELALLNNNPRKATCVATKRSKVALLERDAFNRLLGKLSDILQKTSEKYVKAEEGKLSV